MRPTKAITTMQMDFVYDCSPSFVHFVYKFTGKERDQESGLDDFGARYYASALGRFTSPDWSAKIEPVPYSKLENSQTLNLTIYRYDSSLPHVRRCSTLCAFDIRLHRQGTGCRKRQ